MTLERYPLNVPCCLHARHRNHNAYHHLEHLHGGLDIAGSTVGVVRNPAAVKTAGVVGNPLVGDTAGVVGNPQVGGIVGALPGYHTFYFA